MGAAPSRYPGSDAGAGSSATTTRRRQNQDGYSGETSTPSTPSQRDAQMALLLQQQEYARLQALNTTNAQRQAQLLQRPAAHAHAQSKRFWLMGVLDEADAPLADNFVSLWGDVAGGDSPETAEDFPYFDAVLLCPPAPTREAVLVRSLFYDNTPSAAKRLLRVATDIGNLADSDVITRAVALANTVAEALGGEASDDLALQTRYHSAATKARLPSQDGSPSCVIDLLRLTVGCQRHRALLFKALSHAANVPCRLVRGFYYVGDETSAHVCLPPEHVPADNTTDGESRDDEHFIDLMAVPGTLRTGSAVRHLAMLAAAEPPAPEMQENDSAKQMLHLADAFALPVEDHEWLRGQLDEHGIEHVLGALELRERLALPLRDAAALLTACGGDVNACTATFEAQRGAWRSSGKTSKNDDTSRTERARRSAAGVDGARTQNANTGPSRNPQATRPKKPTAASQPWSYGPSRPSPSFSETEQGVPPPPPPPPQPSDRAPNSTSPFASPHDSSSSSSPTEVDRDLIAERLERETKDMTLCATLRKFGIQVDGGDAPSATQIRAAFRRAALQFHPDRARGDIEREERFKILRAKLD